MAATYCAYVMSCTVEEEYQVMRKQGDCSSSRSISVIPFSERVEIFF